jgi:hypothetical protein
MPIESASNNQPVWLVLENSNKSLILYCEILNILPITRENIAQNISMVVCVACAAIKRENGIIFCMVRNKKTFFFCAVSTTVSIHA